MKPTKIITEVRVIVSDYSDDDREGVVAFKMPDGQWMPLMSADMDRYHNIEHLARQLARITGETYKVVALTNREIIGTIGPDGARYEKP